MIDVYKELNPRFKPVKSPTVYEMEKDHNAPRYEDEKL